MISSLKRAANLNKLTVRSMSVITDLSIPPKEKIRLAESLNHQKKLDIHHKDTVIIPAIQLLQTKNNKSQEDEELLEIYNEMLNNTDLIIKEIDNDIKNIYGSLKQDYPKLILSKNGKNGGKRKLKTRKQKKIKRKQTKRKTKKN